MDKHSQTSVLNGTSFRIFVIVRMFSVKTLEGEKSNLLSEIDKLKTTAAEQVEALTKQVSCHL